MSAMRAPSSPPGIPGYRYLESLGSGGFADVFLYEQTMPTRRVAVKVLLAGLVSDRERRAFEAEANLMATLSTHPSIVTIYQADISTDGRPYLAMEYCPKPNLGVRFRRERFSVAEALRIGIQVAGAAETAHRAGILHRDIKPANILVTEYNRPALTDFGIAGTLLGEDPEESGGMSIPWSPPESFGSGAPAGAGIDIYALGATVYTLLAGRSPFELPGMANSSVDIMGRIQNVPLTPTGRPDVPASLERALATSMAKEARARFSSALEFARALQKVQQELSFSVTQADVLDDSVDDEAVEEEDGGHTRIRGIVSIDPLGAPPVASHPRFSDSTVARPPQGAAVTGVPEFELDRTMIRGSEPFRRSAPAAPPVEVTQPRTAEAGTAGEIPAGAAVSPVVGAARAKRSTGFWIGAIAAAVIVLGVGGSIAVATLSGQDNTITAIRPAEDEADAPADADGGDDAVPQVTGLTGVPGDAGITFTWSNPSPEPGDVYLWGVVRPGAETELISEEGTTVTVAAAPSGTTCIEVSIRRADGRSSTEAATGCAP